MELLKNSTIITNVCKVRIRSIDDVVNMPTLTDVYYTPSKIRYTVSGSRTPQGNLHNRSLQLSYPGLSTEDFQKFDELLRGVYQIFVQLTNYEVYELSSTLFPMECSTRFDIKEGHQLVFSNSSPFNQRFIGVDDGDISGKPPLFDEQFDYDFDFNLA